MTQTTEDRKVILGEIPKDMAIETLVNQPPVNAEGVKENVPKFKKVTCFTTFFAEYGMMGDDIVIHFFHTPENPDDGKCPYWHDMFPTALNDLAQSYFQATAPRLVAKYTEELKSWFFRAQKYSHVLDIDAFVMSFFEKLDQEMDELPTRVGPSQ